jgi:hypothetical protein
MGPVARCVPPVDGERVELVARSMPPRLTVTVSPVELALAAVLTLVRTIRLRLQWTDLLRRPPPSRITDVVAEN